MVRNENNIFISVCSVHLSGIARIFMNLFSVPALCNSDNNGTTSADSGFTYLIISGHKQFCVQKPSSLPEQPQTTSPTDFLQQNKEGPQSPPQSNPKSYITKLPCLLQTKHVPTHWAKQTGVTGASNCSKDLRHITPSTLLSTSPMFLTISGALRPGGIGWSRFRRKHVSSHSKSECELSVKCSV